MTEQQLRALRKKHLLVLVRDLERDLQTAVSEKEQIMLAYQRGQEQARQENNTYAESLSESAEQDASVYIYSNRPDWRQSPGEIGPQDFWQQQTAQQPYVQYAQPQWQQPQSYQQLYTQPYAQQQPNYYWLDSKTYGT